MSIEYWHNHDPYDRDRAWDEAELLCRAWCETNDIVDFTLRDGRLKGRLGTHILRTVTVDKQRCASPAGDNWPGAVDDATVLGVMAHEVAHHWHINKGRRGVSNVFSAMVHESRVTDYATKNTTESVAEAGRLFILNPTLLEALWPGHYAFLTSWAGLKTVIDVPWTTILQHAGRSHLSKIEDEFARVVVGGPGVSGTLRPN